MTQTSKTGLSASPTKKIAKNTKPLNIQLKAIVRPAPFTLKPYSGLYNPYSNGCSLLCNHPMEKEAKELFQKAKEHWINEGRRNFLLSEETEAIIKVNFSQLSYRDKTTPRHLISQIESVPEELFRKYTETDSRPLTPAPTLASGATRASGSRRCVTPDACITYQKAQLILDLRRTHSQETISYSASLHDPPLIRIQHVPTRAASLEELSHHNIRSPSSNHSLPIRSSRKTKTAFTNNCKLNLAIIKNEKTDNNPVNRTEENNNAENKNSEEDFIKRRGKKKKKKDKDDSREPSAAFHTFIDPETQVATTGIDSINQSARTSLVPIHTSLDSADYPNQKTLKTRARTSQNSLDIDSYLDKEILKQLRRELNEETLDNELNLKRRKALEEALKSVSKDRSDCDELKKLQKELKLPKLNIDLWISLPRTFTRSSARFELPLDSRSLSIMTPIEYIQQHIWITSDRKLLFNCIFNKFKMEAELENEHERKLSGEMIQQSLDLLMGRPMTTEEVQKFRSFINLKNEDVVDFRTFCGLAALCERLMAPSYCPRLPDRKTDPCHEIEIADFEMLARRTINKTAIDKQLLKILEYIKIS